MMAVMETSNGDGSHAFKSVDANGKVNFTSEVTFPKTSREGDGKWRPAAGRPFQLLRRSERD